MYKTARDEGTLREGKAINLSLHRASDNKAAGEVRCRRLSISYRNSLLTSVLRDSLGEIVERYLWQHLILNFRLQKNQFPRVDLQRGARASAAGERTKALI